MVVSMSGHNLHVRACVLLLSFIIFCLSLKRDPRDIIGEGVEGGGGFLRREDGKLWAITRQDTNLLAQRPTR